MSRRARILAVVLALLPAGVAAAGAPDAGGDARAAAAHLESNHPDPYHAVSRAGYRTAVARLERRAGELAPNEVLVELMRLGALAGVRDGHGGIFPLDPGHARELHLLPIRLYGFPDGVHVVGQIDGRSLVGERLVAIEGTPVAEALRRVRPLVPHDNRWSREARALQWLLTAEVLQGLGIAEATGRQRLTFARRGTVELAPVGARRYAAAFSDLFHPLVVPGLPQRARPFYLQKRGRPWHTALLGRGRVAYGAYNVTGPSEELADQLERLARRPGVLRVVLDLRLNPGGEVAAYAPLLAALQTRWIDRPRRLYVLIARSTFSAAALLATELDRLTGAVFVGEPTGGAPNLYADTVPLSLPASGWSFHAPTRYWQKSTRGDKRLAISADLPVTLTAPDFLAGRDPVLARALR